MFNQQEIQFNQVGVGLTTAKNLHFSCSAQKREREKENDDNYSHSGG